MVMYYDRRIPESLLALLEPGQPLAWLVERAHSSWGKQHLVHLQFRCAANGRQRGGIQLYLGRTSPLEIRGRAGDLVELVADPFYRQFSPNLWGRRFPGAALVDLRVTLEEHVDVSAVETHRSFIDGEAVAHAGLLRRYGPGYQRGDPFLAVDSEVRVGFGSIAERQQFGVALRRSLGLSADEELPTKLDAMGILCDGALALVEVKDEEGDLVRAVVQVAAHMAYLTRLQSERRDALEVAVKGLAQQKARVGLLPALISVSEGQPLVPIVAAPDADPSWLQAWNQRTVTVRRSLSHLLQGLQFWRLAPNGEILEAVCV